MKISIIIVNYQSEYLLKKCIRSIKENLKELNPEIVVVNNDPKKICLDKKDCFFVKIINAEKNLGFSKACNLGFKYSSGKFILFLNPDTTITDNSLKKAINYITETPEVGALGAGITESKTGKPQPWTCGRKTSLLKILFKNTFNKPWNKKEAAEVDWVSGTSLLTPAKTFQELGGFDENFFMYFEDQDYCLRVKEAGKKVIFYPDFKIIHHNGKSWKNKSSQKKSYFNSQKIFFKKHMPWQSKILNFLHLFLNP
jgi:hypothetical protein